MTLANIARVVAVLGAIAAAAGSASNNQAYQAGQPSSQMTQTQYGQAGGNPPPPQEMEAARALGVWRSTFGAVKIEADNSRGGIETGAIQGVWVYQRRGEEVIGYFSGQLRGNVLQFKWQEPNNPPLTGSGYLVFDQSGRQYSGRWWSDRRDRVGDWNGWRNGAARPADPNDRYNRGDDQDRDHDNDPYGTDQPAPQPQPRPRAQPQPNTYGPQPAPPTYY